MAINRVDPAGAPSLESLVRERARGTRQLGHDRRMRCASVREEYYAHELSSTVALSVMAWDVRALVVSALTRMHVGWRIFAQLSNRPRRVRWKSPADEAVTHDAALRPYIVPNSGGWTKVKPEEVGNNCGSGGVVGNGEGERDFEAELRGFPNGPIFIRGAVPADSTNNNTQEEYNREMQLKMASSICYLHEAVRRFVIFSIAKGPPM